MSNVELREWLPHGESMCLLHEVERWDDSGIVCLAISHQQTSNPLRRMTGLSAICGLEYAAQAMAVHVGLTSTMKDLKSPIGYLGGIRELEFHVTRLDTLPNPLIVQATMLLSQGANFIYSFHIISGGFALLNGRASIFIKEERALS